jgi:hypothetical protein
MEVQSLFEEYKKLLETQTKLDDLSLKEQQLKLPGYKHYWAGRCIDHKRDLAKLKRQREQTKKDLIEKVSKESEVELSKMAIGNKVNQLASIQDLDKEIEEMEMLVLYCEKAEQIMKSFSFDIKNLIDLQKLETL